MKPNDFDTDKDSFSLPEGYFETFEASLGDHLELERLLGGKISSGFSTPNNYFEQLSNRLPTAPLEVAYKAKRISKLTFKAVYSGIAVAAALALVFVLIGWEDQTTTSDFENLDIASIAAYMDHQSHTIETTELSNLLTEEALNSLSTSSEVLSDELLIDYLDDVDNLYQLSIE